jgi:hypothetical protein
MRVYFSEFPFQSSSKKHIYLYDFISPSRVRQLCICDVQHLDGCTHKVPLAEGEQCANVHSCDLYVHLCDFCPESAVCFAIRNNTVGPPSSHPWEGQDWQPMGQGLKQAGQAAHTPAPIPSFGAMRGDSAPAQPIPIRARAQRDRSKSKSGASESQKLSS